MCFHRLKKLCFALNKLYMYMIYSDPRIIWGVRPQSYEKISAQIFSLYEIKGAYVPVMHFSCRMTCSSFEI